MQEGVLRRGYSMGEQACMRQGAVYTLRHEERELIRPNFSVPVVGDILAPDHAALEYAGGGEGVRR